MTRGETFYFEDVVLHGVLETPAMTLTDAHMSLFRGFVGDEGHAAGVIHDLLPLCLSTGLGWRVALPPLAVLAFLGLEWQTLRPLHVGDTIHSRARTVVKRAMREGGIVIEEREIIDQRGAVAQRGRFTFLVARKPGDAALGTRRDVASGRE